MQTKRPRRHIEHYGQHTFFFIIIITAYHLGVFRSEHILCTKSQMRLDIPVILSTISRHDDYRTLSTDYKRKQLMCL